MDDSPRSAQLEASPHPRTPKRRSSVWNILKDRISEAVIGGSAADAETWDVSVLPRNFFELECRDARGESCPFAALRGKVSIVCNVASY